MWFKALKPFGTLKEGAVLELKDDAQHDKLVADGFLEPTDAPVVEAPKTPEPVATTENVLEDSTKGKTKKQADEKA